MPETPKAVSSLFKRIGWSRVSNASLRIDRIEQSEHRHKPFISIYQQTINDNRAACFVINYFIKTWLLQLHLRRIAILSCLSLACYRGFRITQRDWSGRTQEVKERACQLSHHCLNSCIDFQFSAAHSTRLPPSCIAFLIGHYHHIFRLPSVPTNHLRISYHLVKTEKLLKLKVPKYNIKTFGHRTFIQFPRAYHREFAAKWTQKFFFPP